MSVLTLTGIILLGLGWATCVAVFAYLTRNQPPDIGKGARIAAAYVSQALEKPEQAEESKA